jgi:predicted nucleic acid-binding protein
MGMKILRIYIENSVIGGYFDDEFKEHTRKLFDEFRKGMYSPVISSHVIAELENGAPEYVKENLKNLDYKEYVVNEEMIQLAEKYMEQKIVSKNYYSDALHIAVATVIGVDVLVSWNFKHIVNLDKIKLFNSVNLREGYTMLEIRTPREVIENE